ncbi:hypothetical protein PO909_026828 [Leuciscus waleckii]
MPRKGKRSASQKQRRKQKAPGGSSSGNSVSHSVDANPYVLSVTASHFQGDTRYKICSRGYQCTCNALMFLAVHNERNELQSFDLDRILQREDMIERLLLLFQWCFDLIDQQQFDLLPVSFINRITERSNKALSNNEQCMSADVSQLDVQVQDPFQQLSETTVNSDASTNEQVHLTNQYKIKVITSVSQDSDRYKNVSFSKTFPDMLSPSASMPIALSAPNQQYSKQTDLNKQLKKLNKTQRRKAYSSKRHKRVKQRYHCDAHFRARQKEYNLFKFKNKISALKVLHTVRCAQDIWHKYKNMNLMRQQRDTLENTQPDAVQDPTVLRALNVFRDVIKQGPTYVCTCYARALFSNQVKSCDRERYQKIPTVASVCLTGNYVHVCSDCPDQCALENRKTEWICHCCHNTVLRGLMPDIALANKLQFAPIPPELCDLNVLERHVIAKYIPFAKIITLPKGQQRAIKGAVISVASEVETTVNSLPRPRSESQLLTVKLKRRLCYQGHSQFQTLNMQKVLSALRKLKDIHSEYKDIVINAELSEEEMFNEHEQCANDITAPDDEMFNEHEQCANDITAPDEEMFNEHEQCANDITAPDEEMFNEHEQCANDITAPDEEMFNEHEQCANDITAPDEEMFNEHEQCANDITAPDEEMFNEHEECANDITASEEEMFNEHEQCANDITAPDEEMFNEHEQCANDINASEEEMFNEHEQCANDITASDEEMFNEHEQCANDINASEEEMFNEHEQCANDITAPDEEMFNEHEQCANDINASEEEMFNEHEQCANDITAPDEEMFNPLGSEWFLGSLRCSDMP